MGDMGEIYSDLRELKRKKRAFADAIHALRAPHGQAPDGDWLWVKLMGFCKKRGYAPAEYNDLFEIVKEARASHGQAPVGESLRTDALCDLSYSRGLKAGWNYCASDDLAGFERAQKIGTEALRTLKSATAQAAPAAVAGPSGYGPKVTVKRSCSDCKACNSESYAFQGDSGHYVYCEHPSLPERKYIGDTHWDTPDWCPAAAPTTQQALQQEAGPSDPSITLDFKMASELLDMFGGEPGLVTLQHGGGKCHSGAGLYAWHSDLPEEGAAFLGAEPHDEAAPTAQPAPQGGAN